MKFLSYLYPYPPLLFQFFFLHLFLPFTKNLFSSLLHLLGDGEGWGHPCFTGHPLWINICGSTSVGDGEVWADHLWINICGGWGSGTDLLWCFNICWGWGSAGTFFVERCVNKTFAYVKEYHSNILTEKNIFIMPYGENDEEIYGKNLLSIGSWRIESGCHLEDCLTEINIC